MGGYARFRHALTLEPDVQDRGLCRHADRSARGHVPGRAQLDIHDTASQAQWRTQRQLPHGAAFDVNLGAVRGAGDHQRADVVVGALERRSQRSVVLLHPWIAGNHQRLTEVLFRLDPMAEAELAQTQVASDPRVAQQVVRLLEQWQSLPVVVLAPQGDAVANQALCLGGR